MSVHTFSIELTHLLKIFYLFCACVCVYVDYTGHKTYLEARGQIVESGPSFYQVSSGNCTQVTRLGSKHFNSRRLLTSARI